MIHPGLDCFIITMIMICTFDTFYDMYTLNCDLHISN